MGLRACHRQGGDVLFQMAEVHRQIQNQLEEMLKSFHNELLTQLEQKVELDSSTPALRSLQTPCLTWRPWCPIPVPSPLPRGRGALRCWAVSGRVT
uniref:BAR/IMD domain containing adaptor protein 2 n=1 Tax=Ursus maritimus TaxID=29073 RepID=A0A452UJC5_URSMA